MKKYPRFVIRIILWDFNKIKIIWNELRCRSERMCIHIGFYMIVHVIVRNKVSTLTPQMDLSPCTRVYIQGDWWASHLFGFWPIWSCTILQFLSKEYLDPFWLMWWLSYVSYVARQPSAWMWFQSKSLERFRRSWWCLSVTVINQQ